MLNQVKIILKNKLYLQPNTFEKECFIWNVCELPASRKKETKFIRIFY